MKTKKFTSVLAIALLFMTIQMTSIAETHSSIYTSMEKNAPQSVVDTAQKADNIVAINRKYAEKDSTALKNDAAKSKKTATPTSHNAHNSNPIVVSIENIGADKYNSPDSTTESADCDVVNNPNDDNGSVVHYSNDEKFVEKIFTSYTFWTYVIIIMSILLIFILLMTWIISRAIREKRKLYTRDTTEKEIIESSREKEEIPYNRPRQVNSTLEERDRQWQKGIKHIFLGLGFSLLVCFMDGEELAGIGLLITCLGIGQVIISRRYSIDDYKNIFHSKSKSNNNEGHNSNVSPVADKEHTYNNHTTAASEAHADNTEKQTCNTEDNN